MPDSLYYVVFGYKTKVWKWILEGLEFYFLHGTLSPTSYKALIYSPGTFKDPIDLYRMKHVEFKDM